MNVAEYERMYRLEDTYWWFVARHRLIEAILTQLYGKNGKNSKNDGSERILLDVGCGTGAMSARLTRFGKVVSADFSDQALQFSRRRGLTNLVGADAMKLPFASNQFDTIIAMDMLEHLPDDSAARSATKMFSPMPNSRFLKRGSVDVKERIMAAPARGRRHRADRPQQDHGRPARFWSSGRRGGAGGR